jgi:uncharacterized protein YjbI with pentapeptide repeats
MEVSDPAPEPKKISQSEFDVLLQLLKVRSENLEEFDNPFLFENLSIDRLVVPPKTDFSHAHFVNTHFHDTPLQGSFFSGTRFINCRLPNLQNCKFSDNEFVACVLRDATGCQFHKASFSRSVWRSIQFRACSFSDIKFDGDTFMGVSFSSCIFKRVDFRRTATLDSVRFGNARLNDCNLAATDFSNCRNFILDGTNIKDARLPVRSSDPWSHLVRSYTGAHMAFNAMVLAAFFVPFLLKGLGLIALGRLEGIILQAISDRSNHTIISPTDICIAVSCKAVPVWKIVLGLDESWWVALVGLLLLGYNTLRALLTWRVAPLQEDQGRSWKTPRYLPDFPVEPGWWELNFGYFFHWRSFWNSKGEFWNSYAPLWWMHRIISVIFYFAIALFTFRFVQFLQETVMLPT